MRSIHTQNQTLSISDNYSEASELERQFDDIVSLRLPPGMKAPGSERNKIRERTRHLHVTAHALALRLYSVRTSDDPGDKFLASYSGIAAWLTPRGQAERIDARVPMDELERCGVISRERYKNEHRSSYLFELHPRARGIGPVESSARDDCERVLISELRDPTALEAVIYCQLRYQAERGQLINFSECRGLTRLELEAICGVEYQTIFKAVDGLPGVEVQRLPEKHGRAFTYRVEFESSELSAPVSVPIADVFASELRAAASENSSEPDPVIPAVSIAELDQPGELDEEDDYLPDEFIPDASEREEAQAIESEPAPLPAPIDLGIGSIRITLVDDAAEIADDLPPLLAESARDGAAIVRDDDAPFTGEDWAPYRYATAEERALAAR